MLRLIIIFLKPAIPMLFNRTLCSYSLGVIVLGQYISSVVESLNCAARDATQLKMTWYVGNTTANGRKALGYLQLVSSKGGLLID